MIQVNNDNSQLNIINDNSGLISDVYSFDSIKSISKGLDASGNYYLAINFIANDKNNSLRINLSDVSDPSSWTNDAVGVDNALNQISRWMNLSLNDAGIVKPNIIRESGTTGSITRITTSISFASIGTTDALVSFDGGDSFVNLSPGTTVNMDAGDNNDYYIEDTFQWDTITNVGSSLLITYNSRPA